MAVLYCFPKHGTKFVLNLFYFSSQEVFTRMKSDKLNVKHAVMVLLSPKKIVLVQVPLVAAHAHMVRNMFLLCRKYFVFSLVWHNYAKQSAANSRNSYIQKPKLILNYIQQLRTCNFYVICKRVYFRLSLCPDVCHILYFILGVGTETKKMFIFH